MNKDSKKNRMFSSASGVLFVCFSLLLLGLLVGYFQTAVEQ